MPPEQVCGQRTGILITVGSIADPGPTSMQRWSDRMPRQREARARTWTVSVKAAAMEDCRPEDALVDAEVDAVQFRCPTSGEESHNQSGLHRREPHRGEPAGGDEARRVAAHRHRRKRQ
jgi:hypothetical protein